MGAKIQSIQAQEIMAERGTLGLEVTVTTDTGAVGVSTPTAGISTGQYEAAFVVDGGARFGGKGLLKAVQNVEEVAPMLIGLEVSATLLMYFRWRSGVLSRALHEARLQVTICSSGSTARPTKRAWAPTPWWASR